MIIETPSLQFVSVLPEPLSRSDCFYVWPEPPKPYVSQAFAKLHKEDEPDFWQFDMASLVGHQHALQA